MSNDDIANIAQSALKESGIHSTTIGTSTYTIELLPAVQAFAVGTQLLKVFLPALGAYIDGSKKEKLVLPEDNDMFTEVGLLLVSQLDKVSVVDLVSALTLNVKKEGQPVDVNKEFMGNLGGFAALLEFILKENCGSFFTDYLQAKGISLPSLKTVVGDNKEDIPT